MLVVGAVVVEAVVVVVAVTIDAATFCIVSLDPKFSILF